MLAGSAVLLAAGLLTLGLAPTLPVFVAGWGVLGLAMGAGLYDPAFGALGRMYGEQARQPIAHVTLYGGFASTVWRTRAGAAPASPMPRWPCS